MPDVLETLVAEALHNFEGEWCSLTPASRVAEAIRDRLGRFHFLDLDPDADVWLLHHSVDCRLQGMEDCPILKAWTGAETVRVPPDDDVPKYVPAGRFRVTLIDGKLELLPT